MTMPQPDARERLDASERFPDQMPADISIPSRTEDIPATGVQHEILRLMQYDRNHEMFTVAIRVSITGDLVPELLAASLERLALRHAALRTCVRERNGSMWQQLLPLPEPFFRNIDLSGYSGELIDTTLRQLGDEERTRGFDISAGPLFRALLLRTGEREHRLLITLHQLVFDLWSVSPFMRELTHCYDALAKGAEQSPPPLRLSFTDLASRGYESIGCGSLTPQPDCRKQQCTPPGSAQEMPPDFPEAASRRNSAARHPFCLSPDAGESVMEYCHQHDCQPELFFLALFQAIVHRYTGSSCITTGLLIDNRPGAQHASLIGNFSNKIAVRTRFTASTCFADILDQVRATSVESLLHKEVRGLVAQQIDGERLFQPLFVFVEQTEESISTATTLFSYTFSCDVPATEDLRLCIIHKNGRFDACINYNAALYGSRTIERLVIDTIWAVSQVVTSTDTPVDSWRLPSTQSQEKPCRKAPADTLPGCHQLAEIQARVHPERVALVLGVRQLTYGQLDERASLLAVQLVARGVVAGTPVGLCMTLSPELFVAMLAILKAGGAYVPLDPAYPEERLRFMITDSGIRLAVTDMASSDSIRFSELVDLLVIGTRQSPVATLPPAPMPQTGADNLACIMYTSGSTGQPKGVMVSHGNILNFARSAVSRYGITGKDRILQFFSMSFDGSVEEIFCSWAAGATLVLRDFPVELSAPEFFRQIRKSEISVLDLPTAYWHELVNGVMDYDIRLPQSLRLVIIGGEQALLPAYRKWLQLGDHTPRLINTYGPTETTVVALSCEPSTVARLADGHGGLPIGTPLDNTCIAVVSESLALMPYGMPGELLIGGSGVTAGYRNNPDITREKFIDNIPGLQQMRYYRTGDIVRVLEDGNLLFLGRTDSQVKIRGYRIELTGIEAQLSQHPGVSNAAVIAGKDNAGQSFLVAWIIPAGAPPSTGEIRRYLQRNMPDYMVPAHIVFLDAFPHLPNGKIDRNGFPSLDLNRSNDAEIVKPSTGLEQQLVDIWEKVLDVRPIGTRDNFFEIGGHSLMAVRLCSAINDKLGTSITLSGLFQNLTIESLAQQIQKNRVPDELSTAVCMQPGSISESNPPIFFIHVLGTALKFCRPMVSHLGKDIPVYALSVQLLQESPLSDNTVESLAAFYIMEVRKIIPKGPFLFVGISFGGLIIYEMARQMAEANDDVRLVALMDTELPWASVRLDTGKRVQEHRNRLKQDGIGYLAGKIGEKLVSIIDTGRIAFRDAQDRLKLGYYRTAGRQQQMPITVREFAARQENDQAAANYTPIPYPGRVTLFKSLERSSGVSYTIDPELGWGKIALGGVEVIDCPSDHLGMLRDPYVRTVAEHLLQCRATALAEVKAPLTEHFHSRPIRPGESRLLKNITIQSATDSPDAFVSTLDQFESNPDSYWDQLVEFVTTSQQDHLLLLFHNDQCIGYTGAHIDKNDPFVALLRWIWVTPTFRGKGLGTMLIKKIVDWAKPKGARAIELWVSEAQTAAIQSCLNNGFSFTGQCKPLRPEAANMSKQMIRVIASQTNEPQQ